jgi:hypothetical protein
MNISTARRQVSVLACSVTFAVGLLMPSANAEASTISLVGDIDCFGLGGSCPDGTRWRDDLGGVFFSNYQDVGDPAFTDKWSSDVAPSYTHVYALGAPVSATLEIRTAGLADSRGPWNVSFNGTLVGQFPTNTAVNNYQEVLTHIFGIPVGLLTGNDTISLGINLPPVGDGYSIDYSRLTIETAAVPEPTSLTLLGLGLAGGLRRWKSRRTKA